MKSKFKVFW